MSPNRFPPEDPREWLQRAKSNLARARTVIPEVYLEDLCFDTQQAAEKSIKAVLLHMGIAFPYVHDLSRLLTLLEEGGVAIPEAVRDADQLTRYALIARYPGVSEPVTDAQYREAITYAEAVVGWAEQQIS